MSSTVSPAIPPPALPRNVTRSPAGVRELQEMCLPALRRMYRPESGLFAFRIRRAAEGLQVEGTSPRYTSIVLIGLSRCHSDQSNRVLGDEPIRRLMLRHKQNVLRSGGLGDIGLTIWACLLHGDEEVVELFTRLRTLYQVGSSHATVELAWALAGLSQAGSPKTTKSLRDQLAGALLESCQDSTGLWPHSIGPSAPWLRAHVGCFADQVYPMQALSLYATVSNRDDARHAAERCARSLCAAQGQSGQWWWHYDIRSGGIVEEYPVYAVHQHAMGPMALRDLHQAGGADFSAAIERGLAWLRAAPELRGGTLIDRSEGVVWRKVGRRDPFKLVRKLQAAASSVHAALRVPGTHTLFPARAIDFESRPYEYGWMLYAWGGPEQ